MSKLLKNYDILIVGSGIAGLYSSLQFDSNTSVAVVSKGNEGICGSSLAQGGVAAVLQHENDSFDFHVKDTLIAGGYKNDPLSVETLIQEGPEDVKKIIDLGVDFDSDKNGELMMTLEGGHSRRRIVHHRDQTGREMVEKLTATVEQRPNITLCYNTLIFNIEQVLGGFRADLINADGEPQSIFARFVILATGGIGRVYRYTTNPVISTGDGVYLASKLGARIKNLHYIQFHPTAFNSPDCSEQFLISEAVRGEGAKLLNCNLEQFMHRYDERLELAPRDVVSRSIIAESKRTNSNKFYLDITHKGADFIRERFPAITAACLERGYDITKEPVPIFPCQHYLMGGIDVDLNARTTVPRLYAAGECAHTGVHGGNRLASNSLPEALVFGRRAAQDIKRYLAQRLGEVEVSDIPPDISGEEYKENYSDEIREIMQQAYFVMPDRDKMISGLHRAIEIEKELDSRKYAVSYKYCEAKSLACVAKTVLEGALKE
ncbi:MAG: FAD-binding protein [Clostridia bacterium]|nr:FAD-binding protein [Clostridia bacterium]